MVKEGESPQPRGGESGEPPVRRYRQRDLTDHLNPEQQPKRILALDGGGVRGVISLEFLARIETLLRHRVGGDPEFRLSHYFDLVAGTSTGSIIAGLLALGKTVGEIQDLYRKLAKDVFRPRWGLGIFRTRFNKGALEKALRRCLGPHTTLGSPELETGLLVMTKRMDTGSPWPLLNNPKGTYFRAKKGENWLSNADFPLWRIVRASTAAPYFFEPEDLEVGRVGELYELGRFVDGGVSTANNPSLQALQVAALQGFGLHWKTGEDRLLLVSVGTGLRDRRLPPTRVSVKHAALAVLSIMDDCNDLVETQLQWLSRNPSARIIDSEIGNLFEDLLTHEPVLTYQRYNIELSASWLQNRLGEDLSEDEVRKLSDMADPGNLPELQRLAGLAADRQVQEGDFPARFDLGS